MAKYKVLYTKHLVKKVKSWSDGILIEHDHQQVVLKDEESGSTLGSTRKPPNLHLHESCDEDITIFEGYLVRVDGLLEDAGQDAKGNLGNNRAQMQQPQRVSRGSAGSMVSRKPFKPLVPAQPTAQHPGHPPARPHQGTRPTGPDTRPCGNITPAWARPSVTHENSQAREQPGRWANPTLDDCKPLVDPPKQEGLGDLLSWLGVLSESSDAPTVHPPYLAQAAPINAAQHAAGHTRAQGQQPSTSKWCPAASDTVRSRAAAGWSANLGQPPGPVPGNAPAYLDRAGKVQQAQPWQAGYTAQHRSNQPGFPEQATPRDTGATAAAARGDLSAACIPSWTGPVTDPWHDLEEAEAGALSDGFTGGCRHGDTATPWTGPGKSSAWRQPDRQQQQRDCVGRQGQQVELQQGWHGQQHGQQQQVDIQGNDGSIAAGGWQGMGSMNAGGLGRGSSWQHCAARPGGGEAGVDGGSAWASPAPSASPQQPRGALAGRLDGPRFSAGTGQPINTESAAPGMLGSRSSVDASLRGRHASGQTGMGAQVGPGRFRAPAVSTTPAQLGASHTTHVPGRTTATSDNPFSGLSFPAVDLTASSQASRAAAGVRQVVIPVQSASPALHIKVLQQALQEEVNLRVVETAQSLISQFQAVHSEMSGGGQPPVMAMQQQGGRGTGGGATKPAHVPPALLGPAIEKACTSKHILYFSGAQLSVFQPFQAGKGKPWSKGGKQGGGGSSRGGKQQGGRKRGGGSEDDEGEEEEPGGAGGGGAAVAPRLYLTVLGARARIKEFRKYDMWLLSSHPMFQPSLPSRPRASPSGSHLLVVRSLWHAPDRDGKMEVELLTPDTPAGLPKKQTLCAWRGPDVQTELQIMQLLQQMLSSPAATLPAPLLTTTPGTRPPAVAAVLPHLTQLLPAQYSLVDCDRSETDVLGGFKSHAKKKARKAAGAATTPASASAVNDGGDGPEGEAGAVMGALLAAAATATSVDQLLRVFCAEFKLNEDQAAVMQHVGSWLKRQGAECEKTISMDENGTTSDDSPASTSLQPPVCLVHGPFGSGKSTLLAAVIMMLVAARQLPGGQAVSCRVLLAAHTNVAVDRVLCSLQDRGFHSFLRVGSLPRIARAILHRSLHAADDSRDAQGQLKALIAAETCEAERAVLQRELQALQAGAEKARKKTLSTTPVVGTTCCALLQSDVWSQAGSFTVVVLDECSQLTEPTSLIPLIKAQASFLVAAGDPMQLPPVIATPENLTVPSSPASNQLALSTNHSSTDKPEGLKRPLFVRLQHMGHVAHLLRTQYRCHPAMSDIANVSFYNGQLRNGCSAAERRGVLSGVALPAMCFVEVVGGQGQVDPRSRSSYNLTEAQYVTQLVRTFLHLGVPASDIGVICFYKAQVDKIRGLLAVGGAPADSAPASNRHQPPPGRMGPGGAGAGGVVGQAAGDGDVMVGAGVEEGGAAAGGGGGGGRRGGGNQVQVATVDSFQGAEKEVILLATTTTRRSDFAGDPTRLNVAITRAKRHLLVLGNSQVLSASAPALATLITTCKRAGSAAAVSLTSPAGRPADLLTQGAAQTGQGLAATQGGAAGKAGASHGEAGSPAADDDDEDDDVSDQVVAPPAAYYPSAVPLLKLMRPDLEQGAGGVLPSYSAAPAGVLPSFSAAPAAHPTAVGAYAGTQQRQPLQQHHNHNQQYNQQYMPAAPADACSGMQFPFKHQQQQQQQQQAGWQLPQAGMAASMFVDAAAHVSRGQQSALHSHMPSQCQPGAAQSDAWDGGAGLYTQPGGMAYQQPARQDYSRECSDWDQENHVQGVSPWTSGVHHAQPPPVQPNYQPSQSYRQ